MIHNSNLKVADKYLFRFTPLSVALWLILYGSD